MMLKARHHWFYHPFFSGYSRWMPRLAFSEIQLTLELEDRGLPVLMIGNHTSWWDGFVGQYINLEIFRRRVHIMMLEEQLRKRMFLNLAGAYSIRKGSRSALESLQYTAEILKDRDNLVILFPQGGIRSIHDHPVRFEKGWHRIFRYLEGPVQVVFFISLFDYFSSRKPALYLYLYEYPHAGKSPEEFEEGFNRCLRQSISIQKSRV